MTAYQHNNAQITRTQEKPLWWDNLPKRTRVRFKEAIDAAIKDFETRPASEPNTVTLTRRRQNIICYAGLNEAGWDLAYKTAVFAAMKVGVNIDVIAITPDNYNSWWK
jgi:hypothetical protein